jgi:hypothetical protein
MTHTKSNQSIALTLGLLAGAIGFVIGSVLTGDQAFFCFVLGFIVGFFGSMVLLFRKEDNAKNSSPNAERDVGERATNGHQGPPE